MTPVLDGYWLAYQVPHEQTLDQTPSYVDHVTLFVAGVTDTGSQLDTDYLCSQFSCDQIVAWARGLQANGQKVLLSLMDSASIHWNDVDLDAYAQSVKSVALDGWGLDGVDVDAESGMPQDDCVPTFVALVQALSGVVAPEGKLLTYTCYQGCNPGDTDYEILTQVGDLVSWVNLMAYWDDPSSYEALFAQYAAVVGDDKVTFGVKPGYEGQDQSTPLDTVKALARWQPSGGAKAGMMLFGLNRDNPYFTQRPDWTYAEAIRDNQAGG